MLDTPSRPSLITAFFPLLNFTTRLVFRRIGREMQQMIPLALLFFRGGIFLRSFCAALHQHSQTREKERSPFMGAKVLDTREQLTGGSTELVCPCCRILHIVALTAASNVYITCFIS